MVHRYAKGLRALAVFLASLLALVAINTPAGAQSQDPQTPVFSDNSIKATELNAATKLRGVAPFRGTGKLTPDAGVEKANLNVKELLDLKPATASDGIETILGFDSRVRTYTTSYPARAVVLITFTGGRCTGWMYAPNMVATAGHCVHTGGPNGSWRANVRVYPGYNGNVAPYGSCTARWLASVTGWTNSSNEQYDYGVIRLNCTVGNVVGWFGYWWQVASLTGLPSIISGYPGDKPLEQWWSFDEIRVTEPRQVFYLNDTVGGMSGSPVWYDRPAGSPFCANGPCVMAIHAYGLHGAAPHSTHNHGTRIVQPVFNNLIAWRNAP
jgi:glutamyl endopeptidase